MYDPQSLIFRSAASWSVGTALVVLAVGLLYTLQGFRFARFLLALSCASGGLLFGGFAGVLFGHPVTGALFAAAALAVVALTRRRVSLALASAFTFGTVGQYLGVQLGLRPDMSWVVGGLGAAAGLSLVWLYRRTLPIIVTTVQGSGLLVVGFVALATAVAPTLGQTFVEWASRIPLMVPALMLMLCIVGYSFQANARQGNIETGESHGWNDLEAS